MKNKRLVIILSVLIALTIVIVLCSAVFTVQTVSVNWLTKPNVLTVADNGSIISASKIKKNSSVFTLKKEEYIKNIEKSKGYIEVVKIEVKFPNKVIIHAREREPYYYLNVGVNEFAILDKNLKVLEITNDLNTYIKNFGLSPIELSLEGTVTANLTVSSGDFLNIMYGDLFKTFSNYLSLFEDYNTPTKAKVVIKNLTFEDNNLSIYTNLGLNIFIKDVNTNFKTKMQYGFSGYKQYKDSYSTGTILCYTNNTYFVLDDISKYN